MRLHKWFRGRFPDHSSVRIRTEPPLIKLPAFRGNSIRGGHTTYFHDRDFGISWETSIRYGIRIFRYPIKLTKAQKQQLGFIACLDPWQPGAVCSPVKIQFSRSINRYF